MPNYCSTDVGEKYEELNEPWNVSLFVYSTLNPIPMYYWKKDVEQQKLSVCKISVHMSNKQTLAFKDDLKDY